jgi:hypothetical protein
VRDESQKRSKLSCALVFVYARTIYYVFSVPSVAIIISLCEIEVVMVVADRLCGLVVKSS